MLRIRPPVHSKVKMNVASRMTDAGSRRENGLEIYWLDLHLMALVTGSAITGIMP